MTAQQAQTIEQALERARKEGIRILGTGTMKADGSRFWLVSGSKYEKTNKGYVVHQERGHLECNCDARGICKHRAIVHETLKAEAAAKPARFDSPRTTNVIADRREAALLDTDHSFNGSIFKSEDHDGNYLPRDYYQHAYR